MFHSESFKLGASYLTGLVTAHKSLSLLSGEEESGDPFAFELFFRSTGDKIDLTDVIQEEHETALELRPAAEEKAREKSVEEDEEQQEEPDKEGKKGDEQLETPAKMIKKKDPNAPKRPKTAYQLFCGDNRSKLRVEHNALSLGELSTKLSELWKQATAEIKQEYEAKAGPGKEKFKKEKREYEARIKKREREGRDDETPRKNKDGGDDFVERLTRKRVLYATGGERSVAQ